MLRICAVLMLFALAAEAQPTPRLRNAINEIFGSPACGGRGRGAAAIRWAGDGRGYLALERGEIVRYDTASGERTVLVANPKVAIASYAFSADQSKVLVLTKPRRILVRKTAGEYWVLDRKSGQWKQIGEGHDDLLFAKLSPDGARAGYLRGQNIYIEDLVRGGVRQLTSDGSETILNGVSDWVYDEEFSLNDAWRWSPDGSKIAFWQFDQSKVPVYTLVNYTDSLYPVLFRYPYPKAGQTNAAVRLGVVSASGGPPVWIRTPGDPRNIYITRMEWSGPDELTYELMNRLQNTDDVMLANAADGSVRRLLEEHNDTWVEDVPALRWIDGGQRLLWSSERDGWRHAYSVGRDGGLKLITAFPGDTIGVSEVDETHGWLYFIASPESPAERFLYRARLDGSAKPERVTPPAARGTNTYSISPDGAFAFHTQARFDEPPLRELVTLPAHTTIRTIDDAATARARARELLGGRTEFLSLDIGRGVKIDAWLMKPHNFDPAKKYPIIVYVYGEPAGANAVDNWMGAREEFHAALSDDGYLIASFDNRGTPSPKGREWRKVIYGSVGVLATEEQEAALRALAKVRPFIDLDRTGVWGWSGGGSMTDNLMFRKPDLYKVGVAVAAVPDQRLYDSIYQERYMGLPDENAKGYRDGSPINFAEGLRGRLLILHGTGDDNVHFQGDQRLIDRLIELGKEFDFMEYPNRTHGISEGAGTQAHVYTNIARYFEQYLPAGGRSQ
ncbi:MAG: S9 family peptidase [Acidobacteriota bacterium]|nr:S9 family peptidase [Acidobacteriota bacterium]